jgi:sialic acid synthase SpsE
MIGDGQPCFVVAEIGQNHNGNLYTATRLMAAAHEAGVDAVKFCKRHIPSDLTREARNAPYTGRNAFGPTYGTHREALELSAEELRHLLIRAQDFNEWPALVFSTACDKQSVDELEAAIDPPMYKVASRDLDNLPLLEHIAKLHRPMILSHGFHNEIVPSLRVIKQHHDKIIVLCCTSEYPCQEEHVGLEGMQKLRDRFGVLVGLSDHTPGIVAAQAAACLGACMVEKHLTLSRAMPGTDHAASLEPDGMRRLVRNIRSQEKMMHLAESVDVSAAKNKLGRSLVSAVPIAPGEQISEKHLTLKSPGDGIPWRDRYKLIGRVARRSIPADVTLELSDVVESREYVADPRVVGSGARQPVGTFRVSVNGSENVSR